MSHVDPLYDDYNEFHAELNAEAMAEMYDHEEDLDWYDDSMDGDHDSAMTSCGWGTDEDYGHYGDDIDSFHDYYGEDF